jgi:hypothetical protein
MTELCLNLGPAAHEHKHEMGSPTLNPFTNPRHQRAILNNLTYGCFPGVCSQYQICANQDGYTYIIYSLPGFQGRSWFFHCSNLEPPRFIDPICCPAHRMALRPIGGHTFEREYEI